MKVEFKRFIDDRGLVCYKITADDQNTLTRLITRAVGTGELEKLSSIDIYKSPLHLYKPYDDVSKEDVEKFVELLKKVKKDFEKEETLVYEI